MKEAIGIAVFMLAGAILEYTWHFVEYAVNKAKAVYHALRGK